MDLLVEKDSYNVKTTSFEGPFGLLLRLVEEHKLFINEISLAKVTEDYLNYLKEVNEKHPEEISNFIVVAATLILIKSRSLLPNLNLTKEEETDIKNLEDRLKLYELYSKLSINIKKLFGQNLIFAPLEKKVNTIIFVPEKNITKENMNSLVSEVLGRIPKKINLPKIEVKKVVSIEEMIEQLTNRINDALNISFKDFSGKSTTKEEKVFVIVGFLAMLEMVRQGILNVVQENNFDDILIKKEIINNNI